jgi:hypothetical protein
MHEKEMFMKKVPPHRLSSRTQPRSSRMGVRDLLFGFRDLLLGTPISRLALYARNAGGGPQLPASINFAKVSTLCHRS